jgi:Glycosyltransferase family 9 (heptosyltransferase)
MWQIFIRARLRRFSGNSQPIDAKTLTEARSVLFAVFSRYGDSVAAFKIINEFTERHPEKDYLIVTTHQALPYARQLLRRPVRLVGVNKRHDPLRMLRLVRELRRAPPDIGFNPWSNGQEAEYFVSFARHFQFFRESVRRDREYNYYRRLREYLKLPITGATRGMPEHAGVRHIVLCPFSTDLRRRLDLTDLQKVLAFVARSYSGARTTLVGLPEELAAVANLSEKKMVLGKSDAKSEEFLALLRTADLFIGVDAGPLHIADALGIPVIGLFGPTAPESVLDSQNGIMPMRSPTMDGVYCDILSCRDPVCMHQLCDSLDLLAPVPVRFERTLNLERTTCRAVNGKTAVG